MKTIIIKQKSFFQKIPLLLATVLLFSISCGGDDDEKSKECNILRFTVDDVDWNISGTIISYTFPKNTVKGNLTPVITISDNANIYPASGLSQNFFIDEGVVYSVTAEDGETVKEYTVKAVVALSN